MRQWQRPRLQIHIGMGSFQHELHLKPPAKTANFENDNGGLSRKNSRSRGINFKTVTPIPVPGPASTRTGTIAEEKDDEKRTKSENDPNPRTLGRKRSLSDLPAKISSHSSNSSPSSSLKYDFSLPTAAQLESLSMSDKLRLLALKEMAVVELKDTMANLQAKIHNSERDLHSLRTVIQRSLYRQLKSETSTYPRQKGSTGSPEIKSESLLIPHSRKHPQQLPGYGNDTLRKAHPRNSDAGRSETNKLAYPSPPPRSESSSESSGDRSSKLWSNLSKPITFIQSIDQMLSQEFEKSLIGEQTSEKPSPSETASSESNMGSVRKHENDESQFRNLVDTRLTGLYNRESTDDMLQAVSSSLWGFVNDMKTNMVSSLSTEPSPHIQSNGDKNHPKHGNTGSKNGDSSKDIEHSDSESSVDLIQFSDDEDEAVDLTMYTAMRQKK
ncbi:hypothetical protein OXX69_004958 [Metschnikowia pulcherrima]